LVKDGIRLVTTDEAKSLNDEFQLFSSALQWRISTQRPLLFMYDGLHVTLEKGVKGVFVKVVSCVLSREGYKTQGIKHRQREMDAETLQHFFQATIVQAIESRVCKTRFQVREALSDLASGWNRLQMLQRDIESVRLMNSVDVSLLDGGVCVRVLFTNGGVRLEPSVRFWVEWRISKCLFSFGED
jgi:hypothetical protein